jgi:hypothetical protein
MMYLRYCLTTFYPQNINVILCSSCMNVEQEYSCDAHILCESAIEVVSNLHSSGVI